MSKKKTAHKGTKGGKGKNQALRDRKRDEFERERGGGIDKSWLVSGAIGLLFLAMLGLYIVQNSNKSAGTGVGSGSGGVGGGGVGSAEDRPLVAGKQDYSGGNLEQTKIKATVAAGKISVDLADVKKNKIVAFDYNQGGKQVPLIAFISPSGRLFAGTSMCEPCNSYSFHTETDGTLTCNACGTKWDLETMQGISGGCPNYPPQEMKSTVKGGKVYIDEGPVASWKPRTV
ncbi:MAG: DUF2318 domain-containing protein [Actinobacteria bacterium]|nr:MAG: DUF2318 domain-containing protein [Actinomycetota bacterium]